MLNRYGTTRSHPSPSCIATMAWEIQSHHSSSTRGRMCTPVGALVAQRGPLHKLPLRMVRHLHLWRVVTLHKQFLPIACRQPGKKMLLGDNLSSHLSVDIINTCRKENVEFVCLPPNSTDKMQHLVSDIWITFQKYSQNHCSTLYSRCFPTCTQQILYVNILFRWGIFWPTESSLEETAAALLRQGPKCQAACQVWVPPHDQGGAGVFEATRAPSQGIGLTIILPC
jgi:hypothetical protein